MASTLSVQTDRIWQRRWLVLAITFVATFGAYITSHGHATYTSRVLLSAASTRPPTYDSILAQGYAYYLNDPTYQADFVRRPGFPAGVESFSAQFVAASPLLYVQATADSAAAAEAAAPKIAQLYISDINGQLDSSRDKTTANMTAAMMKAWGDRLAASDPNAFTAQIQLQQQIDLVNSDQSNRLTLMQVGAGATATGAGRTRTLATGLLGGLILGSVVAMMIGAATRRLYTDYDITEKTGVRVLEVIPTEAGPEGRARREVQLRHLANIVARASDHAPTSVAVCPISDGEAGSQIARAIAEQRAVQGARTVFVDADLRRSHDTGAPAGVAEFLARNDNSADLVTASDTANFGEISAGATTGDPYPLFDRTRVAELIDVAGVDRDLVVLQVPPISTAPESQIVADVADTTVLVIERGRTTVRDVEDAVRAVNQVGAEVLGVVLVDTSTPGRWRIPRLPLTRQTTEPAESVDAAAPISST